MQRTVKVVGLLLVTGCSALSTSATSKAQAAAWLRSHAAPQQDELGELKTVNPMAYAIVQALLTKRSLGLLDPRHPSPSFAAPPPQHDDGEMSGVEAFAKIAQESGEKPKANLAYPDAPVASAHHNWLSWKPQQSAVDDEAMVSNVLGTVASFKVAGGAHANPEDEVDSAPPAAQPVAPELKQEVSAPAQEAPAQPPTSAMNQENSYLKGIDFFGNAEGAPQKKQHSHVKEDSHDYLASFSFDDDAPAKPQHSFSAHSALLPPVQQEPAEGEAAEPAEPAAAASKPAAPKNALLAWLGKVEDSKTAPAALAQPKSGSFLSVYIKDLQ
eukprot:CAMPEP_0177201264 /NCGR_PEP_ID=MMETSP0367-20130122/26657_1 /TAXON_ID=447022 ORGANISM="Scrippsiella hangoei-like, Strain SHHI-4" /NCGR_SAMPLE_ID=MMETSP0367 /ASSEMBLY_ACC=CAM_ASM_000362 /LENGTH=326 /DNA_ID=CAMNT_0018649753 /DNA_START=40 /DNA_END=1020 /DNA_ORIENTATION=-